MGKSFLLLRGRYRFEQFNVALYHIGNDIATEEIRENSCPERVSAKLPWQSPHSTWTSAPRCSRQ